MIRPQGFPPRLGVSLYPRLPFPGRSRQAKLLGSIPKGSVELLGPANSRPAFPTEDVGPLFEPRGQVPTYSGNGPRNGLWLSPVWAYKTHLRVWLPFAGGLGARGWAGTKQ
jgi:hypothetical protein